MTMEQWQQVLDAPPKSFRDYPSYYGCIRALRLPLKLAYRLRLISPILYFKYLG